MLALSGAVGVINGIVALSKSSFYVSGAQYVFGDLHTWGWIIIVLSCLSLLAAFTVVGGSNFGRWCGIVAAGLSAIGHLLFVQSYPIWSLVVFALDVLVIYALTVYGGARLRDL